MSKKYIIILILNIFLFNSALAQYWEKVTNIPPAYNSTHYLDVFFLPNGQNGWMCGFNGHVIRTTNGGATWLGTTVPGANHLESIHFPSALIGYTSGVEGIWKTTDGGASWVSIRPADTVNYWGCYFANDDVGLVIGEGCSAPYTQYFWRTTNGGASWTLKTYNVPNSGLTDLVLYSPNGLGYATSSGFIWTTLDGGENWSVYEQTGPNIWQEEITNIGNSFLVPYSGNTCSGGINDGGMRFFDGSIWRSYKTGAEMFGAFMINEETGWACGDFNAVYYTNDAGKTWELRNCGIESSHLDDIWFVNANTGWIAGTKVYKLAGDKQTVSKDEIDFGTACIPNTDTGIVYVKSMSFFNHGAIAEITEDLEGVFSIVSPANMSFTVNSCDSVGIIVKFDPQEEKDYTGKLRIVIDGNPFIVNLKGNAYILSAKPSDTLIDFGAVPCRQTVRDTITWLSEKSFESINNVFVVYGPNNIKYLSGYPATLIKNSKEPSAFSAQPADTGWVVAKFGFKMLPCKTNYYVTVKVYGVSPIIESDKQVDYGLNCTNSMLDTIPIANNGNTDLIISQAYLTDFSKGFSLAGWTSKSSLPVTIKPGKSDSIIVSYKAKVNTPVQVSLVLRNNDVTSNNGNKDPYNIYLKGEVLSVRLQGDSALDFGDVCIGTSKTLKCRIKNLGNMLSSVRIDSSGCNQFHADLSDLQLPIELNTLDSMDFTTVFRPETMGDITGVIRYYDKSCGDSLILNIKGRGVSSAIEAIPEMISAVIQTLADTVKREITVRNIGNMPAKIQSYSFNPPIPDLYHKLSSALPFTLNQGESRLLELELSSNSDIEINSRICFVVDSLCPSEDCTELELLSHSNWLDISPDSIIFGLIKCPGKYAKEIKILNKGNTEETIEQVDFRKGGIFGFNNLPGLPAIIKPADSLVFLIVYETGNEGVFNDTIHIKSGNKQRYKDYYIIVNAEFRTPKIALSKKEIDFGTVEQCDTDRVVQFKIFNYGTYPDTLSVSVLNNNDGFGIVPIQEIQIDSNDSIDVSVTCIPHNMPLGNNSEIFRLQSQVCDSTFLITTKANIIHPLLTIDPPALDFGTVWVSESQTKTITISNNSGYDKWVDSIAIDNPFYKHDLLAPFKLQDGGTKEMILKFTSPAMGSYPGNIRIYESSVCYDSSLVSLLASSPEEVYYMELLLDDLYATPGDTVIFTLRLNHDNRNLSHDLTKLGINSIDYKFTFDNYLFYPASILVKEEGNFKELSINREFGKLSGKIDGTIPSKLFLESGEIMKIKGIALASVPQKTIIGIAEFILESPKSIQLTKKDGSLTVEGFCTFEAMYKLQWNNKDYIWLLSNVVTDKINLSTKLEKGNNLSIEAYDLIGRQALKYDYYAPSGINKKEIDISGLQNGTYLIYIELGRERFIYRAVVAK